MESYRADSLCYFGDKDQKRTMSVDHKTRRIINFIHYRTKTINATTNGLYTIEILMIKGNRFEPISKN